MKTQPLGRAARSIVKAPLPTQPIHRDDRDHQSGRDADEQDRRPEGDPVIERGRLVSGPPPAQPVMTAVTAMCVIVCQSQTHHRVDFASRRSCRR